MEQLQKLIEAAEAFCAAQRATGDKLGPKFIAMEKEIEPAKAALSALKEKPQTA